MTEKITFQLVSPEVSNSTKDVLSSWVEKARTYLEGMKGYTYTTKATSDNSASITLEGDQQLDDDALTELFSSTQSLAASYFPKREFNFSMQYRDQKYDKNKIRQLLDKLQGKS
jgi:hypothetical protein